MSGRVAEDVTGGGSKGSSLVARIRFAGQWGDVHVSALLNFDTEDRCGALLLALSLLLSLSLALPLRLMLLLGLLLALFLACCCQANKATLAAPVLRPAIPASRQQSHSATTDQSRLERCHAR